MVCPSHLEQRPHYRAIFEREHRQTFCEVSSIETRSEVVNFQDEIFVNREYSNRNWIELLTADTAHRAELLKLLITSLILLSLQGNY
jgi:hypothetical protein